MQKEFHPEEDQPCSVHWFPRFLGCWTNDYRSCCPNCSRTIRSWLRNRRDRWQDVTAEASMGPCWAKQASRLIRCIESESIESSLAANRSGSWLCGIENTYPSDEPIRVRQQVADQG